jgi:hypothetical protein
MRWKTSCSKYLKTGFEWSTHCGQRVSQASLVQESMTGKLGEVDEERTWIKKLAFPLASQMHTYEHFPIVTLFSSKTDFKWLSLAARKDRSQSGTRTMLKGVVCVLVECPTDVLLYPRHPGSMRCAVPRWRGENGDQNFKSIVGRGKWSNSQYKRPCMCSWSFIRLSRVPSLSVLGQRSLGWLHASPLPASSGWGVGMGRQEPRCGITSGVWGLSSWHSGYIAQGNVLLCFCIYTLAGLNHIRYLELKFWVWILESYAGLPENSAGWRLEISKYWCPFLPDPQPHLWEWEGGNPGWTSRVEFLREVLWKLSTELSIHY